MEAARSALLARCHSYLATVWPSEAPDRAPAAAAAASTAASTAAGGAGVSNVPSDVLPRKGKGRQKKEKRKGKLPLFSGHEDDDLSPLETRPVQQRRANVNAAWKDPERTKDTKQREYLPRRSIQKKKKVAVAASAAAYRGSHFLTVPRLFEGRTIRGPRGHRRQSWEPNSPFEDLPTELLLKIMRLLPSWDRGALSLRCVSQAVGRAALVARPELHAPQVLNMDGEATGLEMLVPLWNERLRAMSADPVEFDEWDGTEGTQHTKVWSSDGNEICARQVNRGNVDFVPGVMESMYAPGIPEGFRHPLALAVALGDNTIQVISHRRRCRRHRRRHTVATLSPPPPNTRTTRCTIQVRGGAVFHLTHLTHITSPPNPNPFLFCFVLLFTSPHLASLASPHPLPLIDDAI